MIRALFAIPVLLGLWGCSTVNHSIGSVQLEAASEPFPDDYQEATLRAIGGRDTTHASMLLVSVPQTMAGENVFGPKRWYVCVRGVEPKGSVPRVPAQRLVEEFFAPPLVEDAYDMIVVFRQGHQPITTAGYDARLCRDAQFEPLRSASV